MNGFLNILKPPGMSSAAVVAYIQKITGDKTGHAGTLDPEAAGILPVMLGRATRLFDYLVVKRKEYIAELAFGESTDTQDAQGIVTEKKTNYPNIEEIERAIKAFTGSMLQRPPAYSAIKQNGVALYTQARNGRMIETEARPIEVYAIELMNIMPNNGYLLRIACGKGVYIRTICHDIGLYLGCPAHMRFLLRTSTGVFDLHDAVILEELRDKESVKKNLLAPDFPLQHIPRAPVPEMLDKACRNGAKLPMELFPQFSGLDNAGYVRLYREHEFIGISQKREDGYFHLRTMMADTAEKCGAELSDR